MEASQRKETGINIFNFNALPSYWGNGENIKKKGVKGEMGKAFFSPITM